MNYNRLLLKFICAAGVGQLVYFACSRMLDDEGQFVAPVAAQAAAVTVLTVLFPNDMIVQGRSNILAVRAILWIIVFLSALGMLSIALVSGK